MNKKSTPKKKKKTTLTLFYSSLKRGQYKDHHKKNKWKWKWKIANRNIKLPTCI